MSFRIRALAVAAAIALTGAVAAAPASAQSNNNTVKKLTQAVTADGVLAHLEAFQGIADEFGDRAAGRPGYDASVDYVVEQLEAAGYTPEVQEFEFDYIDDDSQLIREEPDPKTWVNQLDFLKPDFDTGTPQGTATGPLFLADLNLDPSDPANTSTSGCEDADFAGMEEGAIALVQRGTCGFTVKILNAQEAGAAGVIVMNEGQTGRTGLVSMIGDATGIEIPSVFVTYAVGAEIAATTPAEFTVTVEFVEETRLAYNVIAETAEGNDDNVVMAGAHLDSVQDGAGINDNGSGSAALLETAIQMAKVKPANTVRFAWWGAEEEGLVGSTYYVEQLSDEEIAQIGLYLNFDMVASPNYMFGIYDGDNSGGTAEPGFIPEGSAEIEEVFEAFYESRGEPYQDTDFSGRSDYGPFIAVDIPAGGLFTGAEDEKTAEEAELYGGVAGAAYDPCYHQFCDNLTGEGQNAAVYALLEEDYDLIGNINVHALDVNADAIATAVLSLAYDSSAVNDVAGKPGKSLGLYKPGAAS